MRNHMKVFLPATDSVLAQYGVTHLVPFDPNFLIPNKAKGKKPSSWITDDDYLSACKRLRQAQIIPA